ncbi:hypothetical protein [Sessilibacter corallicola]|uniref:Transferrin-binding protein B C-lobe/N-lobe beta barrel domain-containing protein n=1 Tax=Sessilibacter corallicola TaxID=2904075 RepID=A0ABQ0A9X1_9GAMM
MRLTILHGVSLAILLGLGGCGGDGPRDPVPAPGPSETPTTMPPVEEDPQPTTDLLSGNFSSPIEGLSFVSGSTEGITDANGGFMYEGGSTVTFSLGGIEFGEVTGQELITLVDLVGAGIRDVRVQNINRLLLALDTDNDNSNGIQISEAVQAIADNFPQPDFTIETFSGEVSTILSDVATADNRTPVLPGFGESDEALSLSLACLASGVYSGEFTGDDAGTFLLLIQHERFEPSTFFGDGVGEAVTSGLVFSTVENLVLTANPGEGVDFTPQRDVIAGGVSSGAEFTGSFNVTYTQVDGAWNNFLTSENGTFTGERRAGNPAARYRLSGLANSNAMPNTPDGSALVALDIMDDNSVTGLAVTLRGNQTSLSGMLSNGIISVTGGNFSFNLTFDSDGMDSSNDADLGPVSGAVGTFTNGSDSGRFVGTSCRPI